MKRITNIITRIIFLPFVIIAATIAMLFKLFEYVFNYIVYGGEIIAYNKKMNRKTIGDVFLEIQKENEVLKKFIEQENV